MPFYTRLVRLRREIRYHSKMADEAKSGSLSERERDDLVRISGLLIKAIEPGLLVRGSTSDFLTSDF